MIYIDNPYFNRDQKLLFFGPPRPCEAPRGFLFSPSGATALRRRFRPLLRGRAQHPAITTCKGHEPMHCTMHILHSNLQLQLVATILAHLFLWLTCLTAGAPSMPGVLRKATDSADTMRTITGDDLALQLLQKLMQPLSMLATNLFLICSSSFPGSSGGTPRNRDSRDCRDCRHHCHCCHPCHICHYCHICCPPPERLRVRIAR